MWPASNIVSGQRLVEINTTDWWSASWKQHKHVIGRSGLFSLQKLRHCWTERFLRKRVQLNVLGTNRSQHYRQGANVPEASCLSTLTWVGVPLFPTRLFASCEAQQMERNTFKCYFKFLLESQPERRHHQKDNIGTSTSFVWPVNHPVIQTVTPSAPSLSLLLSGCLVSATPGINAGFQTAAGEEFWWVYFKSVSKIVVILARTLEKRACGWSLGQVPDPVGWMWVRWPPSLQWSQR